MQLFLGVLAASAVAQTDARGMRGVLDMIRKYAVDVPSMSGNLTSYKNCGSASDHAKNLVINITPDPPTKGGDVTTTYDYDLDKAITAGTATYKITYNGIPFSPTVDDLCVDQAGGVAPDPCPLAIGTHHDKSISSFPDIGGKIVTTTTWKDQDGEQILCVEWTVKI